MDNLAMTQTKKESISQNDKGTANGLVDEFQPKLTKWQRFRSIFSNFKINLVLPTLTWLFYHLDILSDILQMHTLQANCHYIFFGCSIAILVVSFMVTVFYVKYHFNNSWCEAFFYVRTFEDITFRYMITISKDISDGREWSEMPQEEMTFVKKVAFIESISESTLQLIISCLVLRSYGTSSDAYSLAVQIFSFVMSLISIVTSFGSRQKFMEELFNTKAQEDNQSKLKIYASRACHVMYSYLPMTIYMVCLYIISISRESLGVLTVLMVAMLHPIVCFVFGKFSDCLHKICRLIYQKTLKRRERTTTKCSKFIARLFVMSLNMYISLIGGIMYFLFKQSFSYRAQSEIPLEALFDFKEVKFNRCECPVDTTKSHCFEVDNNFQNYIAFLPSEAFLLSLFIVPFLMHVLQAALFHLTPPISMLNFVLGTKYEEEVQESEANENEIEMDTINSTTQVPTIQMRLHNYNKFTSIHWISFVFSMLLLLGLIFLPFSFHRLFKRAKEKDVTNVFGCKTKSHLQCFFPFKYGDNNYISCTEDLPYGGKYCAIDDRGLSFDVCSADCPGVCSNDFGLCNIYGGVDCQTCGNKCKIGYEGNQCQTCQNGFYISNDVTNGEVNSTTGEGPKCEICYNTNNQVCNPNGSNQNCGEKKDCGPCMTGYKGDNCGECIPGYFPTNGTNGIVNSTTGEGAFCKDCDSLGPCNYNGTLTCKGEDGITCAKCRPSYKGNRCQFCESKDLVKAGTNGIVNEDGQGVLCSRYTTMVAGGWNGVLSLSSVEVFGDITCSIPKLPYAIRRSPQMFLHKNKEIVICGGYPKRTSCLKLVDGEWVTFAELNKDRTNAVVVSMANRTFIFGGYNNEKSSEVLENGNESWKEGPTIPGEGIRNGCGVAISKDELLLIGGEGDPKRIVKYNTISNTWTNETSLKTSRVWHQCALYKNQIFVTGGSDGSRSVDIITIDPFTISKGNELNIGRDHHGMGLIHNQGKISLAVFGGYNSDYNKLDSIEIFDDLTKTWTFSNVTLSEKKSDFGFLSLLPSHLVCPETK